MSPAEKDARCSRCDEVVGTVVTEQGRATIRLSTSSHGDRLPISCPRVTPVPWSCPDCEAMPPADPICNERGTPESECPAYCMHGASRRIEQVREPLEKLARWYEAHPGVSEHKFVAQQIRLALVGYWPRLPGTADFRED